MTIRVGQVFADCKQLRRSDTWLGIVPMVGYCSASCRQFVYNCRSESRQLKPLFLSRLSPLAPLVGAGEARRGYNKVKFTLAQKYKAIVIMVWLRLVCIYLAFRLIIGALSEHLSAHRRQSKLNFTSAPLVRFIGLAQKVSQSQIGLIGRNARFAVAKFVLVATIPLWAI